MAKTSFEIFNDKVGLIYEYDKSSPLFVRKANTEITKNNVDEAIDILLHGLNKYPRYPTAYFVLGKAYTAKGQFKDAEEAYRKGAELIYFEPTYEFYKKEIDEIKAERSVFDSERGSAFLTNEKHKVEKEQSTVFKKEIIDEEKKDVEEIKLDVDEVKSDQTENVESNIIDFDDEIEDIPNIGKNLEERLDELANDLEAARMPEIDKSVINNVSTKEFVEDDPMIVSETLAKIYEAQNEYTEAIKVYEKLILKHPDKKEEYTRRIMVLKTRSDKTSD